MSVSRLTTHTDHDAWLVHDGPGGRVYELFESKADAIVAHRFHDRPHAPVEIKAIPLRVVVGENEPKPRATLKPAPKGKLTGRWKAYVVLASLWLGASVVGLFAEDGGVLEVTSHGVAYLALIILALWVMRTPVQYKPLVEAAK